MSSTRRRPNLPWWTEPSCRPSCHSFRAGQHALASERARVYRRPSSPPVSDQAESPLRQGRPRLPASVGEVVHPASGRRVGTRPLHTSANCVHAVSDGPSHQDLGWAKPTLPQGGPRLVISKQSKVCYLGSGFCQAEGAPASGGLSWPNQGRPNLLRNSG